MARYLTTVPDPGAVEAFNQILATAIERILAAIHESRSLVAQRDALLPKLVSGEVRVGDQWRNIET